MEQENKNGYPFMRCGKEFMELLDNFKKEWENKNGFKISNSDATNLVARKIKIKGGIRV